ncbi:BZ3500_MvSof-1268-A1-R1_Chr1-1g00853 [Microbotryum saponariae]|uniref:BZ3500_MvSof-1268-A1-R1_Chr1-1g00853 protein n=1 Tax=Microbotryum saponariae TaxID=289078 RepID=A0A2X0MCQ0_9BASI|nr:BZ3500_MvSof-1268-A1-R1_Chr1-1g00853 [Microbotryum saponariae]SCZ92783.1 BZ3501_MvSof-1269-A2-R1_Chr1-1g00450 [Microbotryum saponariae]
MTASKTCSAPQPGPNEAPPSYNLATTSPGHQDRSHLSVPDREEDDLSTDDDEEEHLGRTTGVDEKTRRSMETELMELPKGWVREFDASSQHVYYVDTTKDPPRSIWVHPYEDPEYLASIPDTERSRLFNEADPQHEQGSHSAHASTSTGSSSNPPQQPEKRSFGRKLKDKMTNSTHEERQAERKRQAEEEMKRHQAYIRRRKAMLEASQNGTYAPTYAAPQTVYVRGGGYGPYGGGYGGYGRPMYGGGYGRPMYGGGYGYGYGSPYGGRGMGGAGVGAGLLGGVLLGGLLF